MSLGSEVGKKESSKLTKDKVIMRLKEQKYGGYPGHQARADKEWFMSLGGDDRKTVVRVLGELLTCSTLDKRLLHL